MVRGCSPSWIPWRSCCLTARACLFWARMHLPHGPSEAVLQVSCCRRPGDAPNALASGKSAQEHRRWTSRPPQSCLTRFPWMQCIDAGPRAHPLTELQRGHDAHVMVWLQPAASIGCSMGAGSMWSEGVLWAVSHGESVALRNSTLTFAARTACAQLGSEGACGGRSSGAGASSPNAWGMVQEAPAPSLMHLPTPPIVWHLKLQHPSMQCAAEHLETLDRAEPGHDAHVSARLQRARGQLLQQ